MSSNRNETRIERYTKKLGNAKTFPISVATVNFMFDENLGFVVRSAACFGAEAVHVIGSTPNKAVLKSKSGSTDHFVTIVQHQTPSDFLEWCRNNNVSVVSAELNDSAVELTDYHPTFDKHVCIVVGPYEAGFRGTSKVIAKPINTLTKPVAPTAPEKFTEEQPQLPDIGEFDSSQFVAKKTEAESTLKREIGERRAAKLGAVSRKMVRPMLRGAE